MLLRFCLYGFLKNQQYFEPFLVLAFLDRGLNFFQIGILVAVREVTINAMEIPSGALADIYGRRRSMMFSFVAYMVSFGIFALADTLWLLAPAMVLYGIGDAFRTGTHKAMIFTWLRIEGRESERTKVYGTTRSWSKLGSALSTIIGAGIVVAGGDYRWLFWASFAPYTIGLINFMAYPSQLELDKSSKNSSRSIWRHMWRTVKDISRPGKLRGIVIESMGFEGTFKVTKDYLQPLLQSAAAIWLVGLWSEASMSEARRTALLVGPVYLGIFLLSAFASKRSHAVARWAKGEDRAATRLWLMTTVVFALMLGALWFGLNALAIISFVAFFGLQNIWRPILIARLDRESDPARSATVLSVENQAKSMATMILAPAVGWAVDSVSVHGTANALWPVALVGLLVMGFFSIYSRKSAS